MTEAQGLEVIMLLKAQLYLMQAAILSVGFFVCIYIARRLFSR